MISAASILPPSCELPIPGLAGPSAQTISLKASLAGQPGSGAGGVERSPAPAEDLAEQAPPAREASQSSARPEAPPQPEFRSRLARAIRAAQTGEGAQEAPAEPTEVKPEEESPTPSLPALLPVQAIHAEAAAPTLVPLQVQPTRDFPVDATDEQAQSRAVVAQTNAPATGQGDAALLAAGIAAAKRQGPPPAANAAAGPIVARALEAAESGQRSAAQATAGPAQTAATQTDGLAAGMSAQQMDAQRAVPQAAPPSAVQAAAVSSSAQVVPQAAPGIDPALTAPVQADTRAFERPVVALAAGSEAAEVRSTFGATAVKASAQSAAAGASPDTAAAVAAPTQASNPFDHPADGRSGNSPSFAQTFSLSQQAGASAAVQTQAPTGAQASALPADSLPAEGPSRQVLEQVARVARAEGFRDGQSVTIRLSPPDLGTVRMTFRSDGEGVRCVVQVDSAGTFAQIQHEAPALAQRLAESGVTFKSLDVTLRESGTSNSSSSLLQDGAAGRQFQQQGGQQDSRQWRPQQGPWIDAPADTSAPTSWRLTEGAVNVWR